MAAVSTRLLATQVLNEIVNQGGSATRLLSESAAKLPDRREQALLQELVLGSCRWFYRLQAVANGLLHKPFRKQDGDVYCALLLGLYQIMYTRIPEHAAISESVNVARALGKPWARGLINGVLRNFQRQREGLISQADKDMAAKYSLPRWLFEIFKKDWPDQLEAILQQSNQRPPMCLRVNSLRCSREDYLSKLDEVGKQAEIIPFTPAGIRLQQGCDVAELPGFEQGLVSVQDGAAQLAAPLLSLESGFTVLDACAAPGGKTCQILETVPDCDLHALEIDFQRLPQIQENLDRLGLQAKLLVGDASQPADWWDGTSYDRILVDAPCSGSGVLRRHPDIKLLRKQQDISDLKRRQQAILEALWPLLKPGGRLLYATCSILKAENESNLATFVQAQAQARPVPLAGPWGLAREFGRQILTGENHMDGFYYGCIEKDAG